MLRVLGAVEIDGSAPIRSRARRTLLAALALDSGASVSIDRLSLLIWGDSGPVNRTASLQNHVSRLRKVLPEAVRIESTGSGYRLDVDDGRLDVVAFESALGRAHERVGADRAQAIDEALSLWRGAPYAELDDERAQAETARLEEMLLAAHEMRAEGLVAEGRSREAIGELERLRLEAPLHERTVRLLMIAQLDAGRKSDALATYRAHRAALVEELGLDPSLELRELEVAILTEDVVARSAPKSPVERTRGLTSVQVPTSALFGRGEDLAASAHDVRRHRVVTLLGPGGVGKTRLALHTASAVADDFEIVALVELSSLGRGEQIVDAIASALDLAPRSGPTLLEQIIDATIDRSALVVLDNCDHLIETAARVTEALVQGTRAVHVLATSREPLAIDDEHVRRIRPLSPVAAAADLFADRAAAQAAVTLDETSRVKVERICAALDGIPLAIELAAARCSSMTLDELIDGLDERFVLVAGGRRTAPERHRSLRALVEWSVRSLGPDLGAALAHTSVFSGHFTVAGAAAVTGMSDVEARVVLADLHDRSLLVEHVEPGRTTRYSYLETIRAYASELLAELPDADAVLDRHSDWIVSLSEAMAIALATADDVAVADGVIASLPDLRTVHARLLARGDVDRALRLCCALRHLALFRMHAEMFRWIRECAIRFADSGHPLLEETLAAASVGSWQSGDLDGARHYAEAALAAAEASSSDGASGAGGAAHEALADVVEFAGDDAAAVEHFELAVAAARAGDDQVRLIANLADLVMVLSYAGEHERLTTVVDEAAGRAAASGSAVLGAWAAYAEGEAYAEVDPDRATRALTTALELAERSSAQFIWGVAGLTLTGLQTRTGDVAAAIPGIVDLLEHWRRGGAWVQQWITLRTVVDLLVRVERHREAAIVLGAVRAADDTTNPSGPDALRLAAAGAAIEAEVDDSHELYETGASMGQRVVTDRAIELLRALGPDLTAI